MSPRHDGIAGRGANRVRGISARKAHPCGGDAVAVRGLVEGARIIGPDVHVAQVVHQEKDNVGFPFRRGEVSHPGGEKSQESEEMVEETLHRPITALRDWAWQVEWEIFLHAFAIFHFR